MSNDTLTNEWFHRLKAAHRKLIKLNGGIEEAAKLTSLSKSQIGRCHSGTDTELLPPAAVMRLEAECGDYVVTRAQAEVHGCRILDPRERQTEIQCLQQMTARLHERVAEYSLNHARSIGDLHMSPAELQQGLRDLQACADQIAGLMNAHSSALAKGGVSVAPLRYGLED